MTGLPLFDCQCGHCYADHEGGGECKARVVHHDYIGIYHTGCTCQQYEGYR